MSKKISKFIATTGKRVSDLSVDNGQMIFIQDSKTIALDFNDKRVYYNGINILETEEERINLTVPLNGSFYFVVETTTLWYFRQRWIQSTSTSDSTVFIGSSLPSQGSNNQLYVDTTNKNISIWDIDHYESISEKLDPVTDEDINNLFK